MQLPQGPQGFAVLLMNLKSMIQKDVAQSVRCPSREVVRWIVPLLAPPAKRQAFRVRYREREQASRSEARRDAFDQAGWVLDVLKDVEDRNHVVCTREIRSLPHFFDRQCVYVLEAAG